jgi:hypothetical protein
MAGYLRIRVVTACLLGALTAALAPAAASAAPDWQPLADPPRADVFGPAPEGPDQSYSFTLASGVPTVAYVSFAGIRVAQATPDGASWEQVGAPIRHALGPVQVYEPSVAADPDGDLWVTWTELAGNGIRQARVARFDGTSWNEVVGGDRPINIDVDPRRGPSSAYEPQLAFFGGTAYVVYSQDNPAEIVLGAVRLKTDGSAWERIDPPATTRALRPGAVVSGGRLYASALEGLAGGAYLFRLNSAGTGWDRLGGDGPSENQGGRFGGVADLGSRPGLLFASPVYEDSIFAGLSLDVFDLDSAGAWQSLGGGPLATSASYAITPESLKALDGVPYAAWLQGDEGSRSLEVAAQEDGTWNQLPSPSGTASDAVFARLATGDTGVFLMWAEEEASGLAVHVAQLAEPAEVPPTDGGGGTGGDGGTPGGEPEPGPVPEPTGHCSNAIKGSALGDVLRGTRRSDSISGLAGNDTLYGFGGNDCLFGGTGSDTLSGGDGGDTAFGGQGADDLLGGSGADDLNGGAGKDLIIAGTGRDEVGGGSGNDRIHVRGGGSDLVACGSGHDVVWVDRSDATRGCERILVMR